MPILPVRDLAKFGVITDVDPYDLPIGAWSMGVNVRFFDNKLQRGPIFRDGGALAEADPRFVYSFEASSGYDTVFIGYKTGRIYARSAGSETDFSLAAYVDSSVEDTWTGCDLGGCVYINRPDRVPWVLMPAGVAFVALGGGWDATWRAELLRTYNGALVALNVTKGATAYPSLVKTSDIVDDIGIIPTTWDHTDPSNNATENPMAEATGAIIDAQKLGESLVIYFKNQSWLMTADGSSDVYSYRRLPFNKGAINANCSIEVGNKHFVFGTDDIWVHDGVSEQSISDGRVRKFIFSSINGNYANRCFVAHNSNLKEIAFCFYSGDSYIQWTANGCNRSAVYNYADDKWTFDDLPLVFSAAMANADNTLAWDTVGGSTWITMGGSWQDQEAGFKRVLCFVGETSATYSLTATLYGQDMYTGGLLATDAVPAASPTMTLERTGIDLDEVGAKLSGYKVVLALYPQGRLDSSADDVEFAFGSEDYYSASPTYGDWMTYNTTTNYKLDYSSYGRFLSMKMRYQDYKTMSLSGLDMELETTGER